MEAGRELFANNPMSVICATVCNHEMQCAGNCMLGRKGTPVHFSSIESYISDAYLDRMTCPPIVKKNKRVAVIGSGPAGMTVAIVLGEQGYDVTVFESRDKIGGAMQYGIPEFRLPKSVLTRYKKKMQEIGIVIRPNTTIGGALKIDDLIRDGYASVFVGTGVWRPKTVGVRGESLGNVAMDVARTAFRHGAKRVMLFARGKRVTASSHEVSYAMLDGAEFMYAREIESITPEGPVFKKSVLDENGKIISYEEDRELVHADSTIICISQGPKDKLINTTHGLKGIDKGLLVVDENCMTTIPGVFAAGDVVHGSKTVVHAVAEAKKAAKAMMEYMEKNN